MSQRTTAAQDVPSALANFDSLPDSAHVRLPVVAGLLACSPNTVWRRVRAGTVPAPVKLSVGISAWNVGALRRALQPASGEGGGAQ